MADPAYRRIADSLRHAIEAGTLVGGDQLPTEQELAEECPDHSNTRPWKFTQREEWQ